MKTIWGKVGAIVAAAALVAVLVFSYVSAITNYDFTVFIFAGAADQETNRQLIEEWAAQYAEEHKAEIGKDSINVGISFQSDTNLYFSQVQREIASGKADDVFYVSPKYVKSFALNDAVLDLGEYVDWTKYDPNGVWADAVGAYAFVKEDNSIGNPVTYQENGSQGAGFYNEAGKKAGVYALPKDFSSFGLAYNRNFFTQTLREKYTTTEDTRGAVYSINADGSQGAQTNIINIGKTTRYYPFNYYKYENYRAALDAGDPIAAASKKVEGYDVTIMGWPGDTYYTGKEDDPLTSYDDRIGYVTYTYAEYGAMAWAVGYYAQFYDLAQATYTPATGRPVTYEYHVDMPWLNESVMENGKEVYRRATAVDFVYGNDQYEGPLYLTAWLLGNGVDIISDDYRSVTAPSKDADYGINSDKFKEAYAAFLAFGSDWNANSYYSGSGESVNTIGGWGTFNSGRCIFYGCGTWDMATFNSTVQSTLAVGIMPEPVSESLSPYARVKGAEYTEVEYGTDPVTDTSYYNSESDTYSDAWLENMNARQDVWAARLDTVGYGVNADVLDRYGEDGWQVAACADLCAYLTLDREMQRAMTYSGSQLTSFVDQGESYLYYQQERGDLGGQGFEHMITPDGNAGNSLSVTVDELTTAGVTPASVGLPANATGTQTIGDGQTYDIAGGETPSQLRADSAVWTFATAAAQKMYADHTTTSYRTVKEYVTNVFPSLVPYLNTYFENSTMGEVISLGFAFKCLNLIALNYEDRNLQLRMVSGVNGALDSCMYTYNSQWIDEFGATKGYTLIAYEATRSPGGFARMEYGSVPSSPVQPILVGNADGSGWQGNFYTPAMFCEWIVLRSQRLLDLAVEREDAIANQA